MGLGLALVWHDLDRWTYIDLHTGVVDGHPTSSYYTN